MSTARKSSLLSKTADMEKFAAFKAAKAAAKEADRLRLAAEYPHLFGGSANAKGKAERMTPNKRKVENDENMPNNTASAPGSAKKPRAVNPSNLRTLPSKAQVQVLGGKKNVSFTLTAPVVLVSTRSSSSSAPKEVEMEAFAPKPLPPVPAPVPVPEEAQQQVEEVLDYLLTTSEVLPALHQRLSRQSASFASSLHRRSSLGVGALGDGEVLEKMRKVIFSLEESTAFTETSTPEEAQGVVEEVQGVLDVDQLLDTAEEVVTAPPAPLEALPVTPSVVRYATTHPRAALLEGIMSRGLLIGEVSGHAVMSGHVKYHMNLSTLPSPSEKVQGIKVVLWKRYSDCKNLHSTLTELIGQQQMMPLFPPKDPACDIKDGKQADPAALAARTEGLGLWLTGVLALQAAQGKGYRDALYGFISN